MRALSRAKARLNRTADTALHAVMLRRYGFVGDGIASVHFRAFASEPQFTRDWKVIESHWQPGPDVRWRVWILRQLSRQAARLPGSFAEFGTYRGGCAAVILSSGSLNATRRLYLFDTFAGTPRRGTSDTEAWMIDGFGNTSPETVAEFLAPWDHDNTVLVVGNVFDTLLATETGPLAFAHMDLNAAEPTRVAFTYVLDRLVAGGIVLFDDYGWAGYEEQRSAIDEISRQTGTPVVHLPTGQAFVSRV
jgi:O-methyltransferase